MMDQFYKILCLYTRSAPILFLLIIFVFTTNVNAASSLFPTTKFNDDNANITWTDKNRGSPLGTVIVTKQGNGVTLDAPVSKIRVFYYLNSLDSWSQNDKKAGYSGNPQIKIDQIGCGVNKVGNQDAQFQLKTISGVNGDTINWQNYGVKMDNGTSCSKPIMYLPIDINVIKASKAPSYYTDRWGVVELEVTKIGDPGIVNFTVSSGAWGFDGAIVSFAEQSRDQASNGLDKDYGAFSLWNGGIEAGNNPTQFNLNFKPDCGYVTPNRNNAYLKWTDADQGQFNQNGDISFQVYRHREGATGDYWQKVIDQQPNSRWTIWHGLKNNGDDGWFWGIGGQGDYGATNIEDIRSTDTYKWQWQNVSKLNGIQFWLPFSEANNNITCNNNPVEDFTSVNTTIADHEKGTGDKIVHHIVSVKNGGQPVKNKSVVVNIKGKDGNGNAYSDTLPRSTDDNGSIDISRTIYGDYLDDQSLPYSIDYSTKVGSSEFTDTLHVYEAPFAVFRDNDVRACADPATNRFVFKPSNPLPSNPLNGSYTNYASLWTGGDFSGEDFAKGYSNGLANPSGVSLRAKGSIDCGNIITMGGSANLIRVSGNFSKKPTTQAKNVVISGNITSSYDYLNNSNFNNPPVWYIKAENVYINSDVTTIQGVVIEANNVYTCTNGTDIIDKKNWHKIPISGSDLNGCRNPLRIEGSVSAKNIFLMRSIGSRYFADGNISQFSDERLNQPAEVIVYPAYFYFTNVGGSGGTTKGSIDSYSQAAPRL